jgi:hypothetical protein
MPPHDLSGPLATWTTETVNATPHILYGVWGTTAGDVFVIGGGIYRRGGDGKWSANEAPVGTDPLFAITGYGTEVIVAGEYGTIMRRGGSGWDTVGTESSAQFRAVWGDASRVIAVGVVGNYDIITAAGPQPSNYPTGGDSLLAVWGSGMHTYMTAPGRIMHHAGSGWSEVPIGGGTVEINGIWGASPSELWAVGTAGAIYRSGGHDDWTAQPSGDARGFYAVGGTTADDVWVAGTGGAVWHYDGARWQMVDVGSGISIYALWVSATDVYLAGDDSTVVHGRR